MDHQVPLEKRGLAKDGSGLIHTKPRHYHHYHPQSSLHSQTYKPYWEGNESRFRVQVFFWLNFWTTFECELCHDVLWE